MSEINFKPDSGSSIIFSGNDKMINYYNEFKQTMWDKNGNILYTVGNVDKVLKLDKYWLLLLNTDLMFFDLLAVKDMNSIIFDEIEKKQIGKFKYKGFIRSSKKMSLNASSLDLAFNSENKDKFFNLLNEILVEESIQKENEWSFLNIIKNFKDEKDLTLFLKTFSDSKAQAVIVQFEGNLIDFLQNKKVSIEVPRVHSNNEAHNRTIDLWRSKLCYEKSFSAEEYILSSENILEGEPAKLSYEELQEMEDELEDRFRAQEEARDNINKFDLEMEDSCVISVNSIDDFIKSRDFKSFPINEIFINSLRRNKILELFKEDEIPLVRKFIISSFKLYGLEKYLDSRLQKLIESYISLRVNKGLFDEYKEMRIKGLTNWDSRLLIKYVFNLGIRENLGKVKLRIYREKLNKLFFKDINK